MRSFAIALIAAAVATFTSAVPIASEPGLTKEVGDVTKKLNGRSGGGLLGLVGGEQHQVRSDPPSVAVICAELSANVQPLTVKLSALETADITVDVVADIVADIKASVNIALPKLQALVGADARVILAGTDGRQLTVADLSVLVAVHLKLIFVAIAQVIAKVDVSVKASILKLFVDLGVQITALIKVVVDVVVGIDLSVQVQAIAKVIVDLGLNDLAHLCGIASA